MSVNNFDVLKAMSARDKTIMLAPDIIRATKTKAGTQVTVGVPGDVVAAIADGKLVGGLLLYDPDEYMTIAHEMLGQALDKAGVYHFLVAPLNEKVR